MVSSARLQLRPVLVIRFKLIKGFHVFITVSDGGSLSESGLGQGALLAGCRVDLPSDSVQGGHTERIGSSRRCKPSRVIKGMQGRLTTDNGVVVVIGVRRSLLLLGTSRRDATVASAAGQAAEETRRSASPRRVKSKLLTSPSWRPCSG